MFLCYQFSPLSSQRRPSMQNKKICGFRIRRIHYFVMCLYLNKLQAAGLPVGQNSRLSFFFSSSLSQLWRSWHPFHDVSIFGVNSGLVRIHKASAPSGVSPFHLLLLLHQIKPRRNQVMPETSPSLDKVKYYLAEKCSFPSVEHPAPDLELNVRRWSPLLYTHPTECGLHPTKSVHGVPNFWNSLSSRKGPMTPSL